MVMVVIYISFISCSTYSSVKLKLSTKLIILETCSKYSELLKLFAESLGLYSFSLLKLHDILSVAERVVRSDVYFRSTYKFLQNLYSRVAVQPERSTVRTP